MKPTDIQIPPTLKPGDTVGLVCPATWISREDIEPCVRVLTEWGYNVRIGDTIGSRHYNFSGSDEARLRDLQSMLDDSEVNAVLCARGGYGTGRIIDSLDFSAFMANPKWVIGFSDITILLTHLTSHLQMAAIHGPMASAFQDDNGRSTSVLSLKDALEGRPLRYETVPHNFNRLGTAEGPLLAGNLAILCHLTGSPSDIQTDGAILCIEDFDERHYAIDRLMYHLKRSGKLEKLSALVVGSFTNCKDDASTFGRTAEEIVRDIVEPYGYPVCFGFPVGHGKDNYALRLGKRYELCVAGSGVVLEEKTK
jgi:muramoyltetrapeptide carboxypeptidase